MTSSLSSPSYRCQTTEVYSSSYLPEWLENCSTGRCSKTSSPPAYHRATATFNKSGGVHQQQHQHHRHEEDSKIEKSRSFHHALAAVDSKYLRGNGAKKHRKPRDPSPGSQITKEQATRTIHMLRKDQSCKPAISPQAHHHATHTFHTSGGLHRHHSKIEKPKSHHHASAGVLHKCAQGLSLSSDCHLSSKYPNGDRAKSHSKPRDPSPGSPVTEEATRIIYLTSKDKRGFGANQLKRKNKSHSPNSVRGQKSVGSIPDLPLFQSKNFRLGDVAAHRDMIIEPNPSKALELISSLRAHNFAFVRRSKSHTWTYAIIAEMNDDCIRFVVDRNGSTKTLKRKKWAKTVRLVNRSN